MFAAMHSHTNARVLRWLLFRCFCLSFLRDSCPLFRCLFLAKRLLFICSLSAIGVFLLYIYIHIYAITYISPIYEIHIRICISHICPISWLLHWCSWTNTSFKIHVRFLLGVWSVYFGICVFVFVYSYFCICASQANSCAIPAECAAPTVICLLPLFSLLLVLAFYPTKVCSTSTFSWTKPFLHLLAKGCLLIRQLHAETSSVQNF